MSNNGCVLIAGCNRGINNGSLGYWKKDCVTLRVNIEVLLTEREIVWPGDRYGSHSYWEEDCGAYRQIWKTWLLRGRLHGLETDMEVMVTETQIAWPRDRSLVSWCSCTKTTGTIRRQAIWNQIDLPRIFIMVWAFQGMNNVWLRIYKQQNAYAL